MVAAPEPEPEAVESATPEPEAEALAYHSSGSGLHFQNDEKKIAQASVTAVVVHIPPLKFRLQEQRACTRGLKFSRRQSVGRRPGSGRR
jgi:hypothetical protein